MPDENLLRAYALSYVSYLFRRLNRAVLIEKIILFGSVAKRVSTKDSDLDIFIEVLKKDTKLEKEIIKLTDEFYQSREAVSFKLSSIENKIHLIIGKIEEWNDLQKSIENEGIVLYGSYVSSNVKGVKKAIIYWDNIKKNRGAFLNKIYGFNSKGVYSSGVLTLVKGSKLGKSCIIIPINALKQIEPILRHYGVNAKIVEVYY